MPKHWSRRLPRPLVIPRAMTLTTLADVRELTRHLPDDHREFSTWQHVAAELDKAAAGADVTGLAIALRMVLMLENVECRPAVTATATPTHAWR
jgi:hypothetical protein